MLEASDIDTLKAKLDELQTLLNGEPSVEELKQMSSDVQGASLKLFDIAYKKVCRKPIVHCPDFVGCSKPSKAKAALAPRMQSLRMSRTMTRRRTKFPAESYFISQNRATDHRNGP